MFRVEFFCEDKNLAGVMHTISGKAMNLNVVPVANAVKRGGSVEAETSGDIVEIVAAWMKREKRTEITRQELKALCIAVGKSESYIQSAADKLVRSGLFTKSKQKHNGHHVIFVLKTKPASKGSK